MASLLLMMTGLSALYFVTQTRMRWPIIVLIAVAPTYMTLRTSGAWDGMNLVHLVETLVNEDRAQSLELRFTNEDLLTDRALEKPIFGWAGWGRSRVYDRFGKDISITDGMWVIAMGQNGLFGLVVFTLSLLLPVWLTLKRIPPGLWAHPKTAPAAALSIVLILYMIDNLLNAMINPVFMLVAGALAGQQAVKIRRQAKRNNARNDQNPYHEKVSSNNSPADMTGQAARSHAITNS